MTVWSARFIGHANVYEDGGPFAEGPCLVPERAVRVGGNLPATVEERHFAGDAWEVTARVADVTVRYRADQPPFVGSRVHLEVGEVVLLGQA